MILYVLITVKHFHVCRNGATARFLLLEIHQQKWYWVHLSGQLSESSSSFPLVSCWKDQGGGRSRIWCSWRSTRALARGKRDGNWWNTWRFRGYFDEWGMNQGDYCYILHVVGIVVTFNQCQIRVITTVIVSIGILGIVCDCWSCFHFGQYCYVLSTTCLLLFLLLSDITMISAKAKLAVWGCLESREPRQGSGNATIPSHHPNPPVNHWMLIVIVVLTISYLYSTYIITIRIYIYMYIYIYM